jgi:RNA polymerase sigma-70 factor, ECF subfamily
MDQSRTVSIVPDSIQGLHDVLQGGTNSQTYRVLLKYCLDHIRCRETAKDILQDVLFQAWRYMQSGKQIENPRSFLFQLVRHGLINEYRRWRRRRCSTSLEEIIEMGFDIPHYDSGRAEITEEATRVLECLDQLTETIQQPIRLRYIDGLTPEETAQILGVTTNVVYVRTNRGFHQIRAMLGEE